jgi:GTP1/Obg family GTP-binding protein
MNKKPNDVIILGAGASATSGYPIGRQLRLLMAFKDHFPAALLKVVPASGLNSQSHEPSS